MRDRDRKGAGEQFLERGGTRKIPLPRGALPGLSPSGPTRSAVITAITPAPRRENQYDLEVDGHRTATVSLDDVERLGIRVGIRYEPLAESVRRAAAVLGIQDRALDLLARRARSRAELRRTFIRKGEPADLVDATLDRLETRGFIDDAQFARAFVRSKVAGAGLGPVRLRQELARRGVDRAVADAAVAAVFQGEDDEEPVDERAVLERIAAKKLPSLRTLAPEVRRRRLYAFLARRGYDPDSIRSVTERLLGEQRDSP
ncbi:MAG: regulatory protein RecX [Gemmatimonadaceae bacterium]